MIEYTTGNLLEADVDALVNTVNTVGVMGKGIALMFKEAFPDNYKAYAQACKAGEVQTGSMFVTEQDNLVGPRFIINFPTKQHWRSKSKLKWVESGLEDLRRVINEHQIHSIAIPPLGSGNGGLAWDTVRPKIEQALGDISDLRVVLYEPLGNYPSRVEPAGVNELTPARALIAELIRRYWSLGIECSIIEAQKLAWFLERINRESGQPDPLDFRFQANRYGPYADRVRHLLKAMDGSYLLSDRRLADAGPGDSIWFNEDRAEEVQAYLKSDACARYKPALSRVTELIDGFQSPLGMELLATVDWLIHKQDSQPELNAIKRSLADWPAEKSAVERKKALFGDELISKALERLHQVKLS